MASVVDENVIRNLLREYHPNLTKEQLMMFGHVIAEEIELLIYDRIRYMEHFTHTRVVEISSRRHHRPVH